MRNGLALHRVHNYLKRCLPRHAARQLLAISFISFLSSTVVAQSTDWATLVGGSGNEVGYSVATDVDGSAVIVGSFEGATTIGGRPLNSVGYSDVFVAKFSSDGAFLWVKQIGGISTDQPAAVAVDAQTGDVIVTGEFAGAATIDNQIVHGAGETDIFVSRFSKTGELRWMLSFGGPAPDVAAGVAVDANGDSLVAGHFGDTFACGQTTLTSAGGLDMFVAKLTNTGAVRWCRRYGTGFDEVVDGIATNGSGLFAVTGAFSGESDLGGGRLVSAGLFDAFTAAYSSEDGGYRWARRAGGTGYDAGRALTFDATGALIVTGYFGLFGDAVDFGGGSLASHGGADAFVAKYESVDGAYEWANTFGGPLDDYANGVGVDRDGNVTIAGEYQGDVKFADLTAVSVGQFDAFVARLSSHGTPQWWRPYGDIINDKAEAVSVDFDGNAFVAGFSVFRIDLGAGSLVSAGMSDAFLLKLVAPILATLTPTRTATPTLKPPTPTATPTVPLPTPTNSFTPTPSFTFTPTRTATSTVPPPAPTNSFTSTPSFTFTPTRTAPLPPSTPTSTSTPRPSFTFTPTRTTASAACAVDCDGDGAVTVSELVVGINIVLGRADLTACGRSDTNEDGTVMVNEVVSAIRSALTGCL